MESASLVMTGPLGVGAAACGLIAPPEPPHALNAIAAAVLQIAMRVMEIAFLPGKSTDWPLLALQHAVLRACIM